MTLGCPGSTAATLAAAVAAAPSGGTVQVCAGTFAGGVTITKPLTLLGAKAGVDGRGRTTTAGESVITGAGTAAITVGTGVSGVRIDGFTIANAVQATTTQAGILAVSNGAGITISDNVISRFSFGVNMNSNGSAPSLVSRNRFAENNGVGGQAGVFLCCGPANNLTISDNYFTGHSGDAATAVNTAGDAAHPSTGLKIVNNQSIDDSTFAVVVNATGAVVSHNQVIHTATSTVPAGSAILVGGGTNGVAVSDNSIVGGQSTGVRVSNAFGPANIGLTVTGNNVVDRQNGVRLTGQTSGRISGNNVLRSAQVGILLDGPPTVDAAANAGVTVTGNKVLQSTVSDCTDRSTGAGTAGTANTWTGNIGVKSTPARLCALF
ncbi:hypothetical protein GCM10009836_14360 [Pseudonocardia ailaonensis]|uniref:Right handed beta helix domain-containing protein n=1 Tax=Pseudonocardia ailaonensis TaxID=367279 RepID=A0ABN2MS71_9PSEU